MISEQLDRSRIPCYNESMEKKKKKTPTDINQLAASIVAQTTGSPVVHELNPPSDTPTVREKNPAAVALGRLGGLKGGKARAESLSAERMKEIARNAAKSRWEKKEK